MCIELPLIGPIEENEVAIWTPPPQLLLTCWYEISRTIIKDMFPYSVTSVDNK